MRFSSVRFEKFQWLGDHAAFRRQWPRVLMRIVAWEIFRLRDATVEVPFDGQEFTVHCSDGAGRLLYYFRSFDDEILAFLEGYLKPGQVVVDVGANIGIYSAFAARRVAAEGRVFSFEPNPDVFRRLAVNAPTANVRRLALAVGSAPGTVGLRLNADTAKSSVVDHGATDAVRDVPCVTLDEFLREHIGGGRIDYLKIDVEGFDYDVLLGARQCLARQAIGLVQAECSERQTEMFRLLTGYGYRVCRLTPDRGMVPVDSPENLPFNLFAFRPDIADAWIGGGPVRQAA